MKKAPPSTDLIAAKAFEIFQRRGATDGNAMEDWLQAERELAQPPQRRRRKNR